MKNLAINFLFFILCFLMISRVGFCQKMEGDSKVKIVDSIYIIVDENASFPGGFAEFEKFQKTNFNYPPNYQDLCFQGKLAVKFIVRKDGTCSDFIIHNGIPGGPDFDKSAMDLMKKMPVWKPAKMNGIEVDCYEWALIDISPN